MSAMLILFFNFLLACGDSNPETQKAGKTSAVFVTGAAGVGGAQSASSVAAVATTPLVVAAENKEQVMAALKKADLADGKEDKVVEKCSMCALHMYGKPEHSVTVEDTTLHMCAAACKTAFEEEVEKNLLSLL